MVRWLKENRHKATADEGVSKLRWLDWHLRGEVLTAIDRNVVTPISETLFPTSARRSSQNSAQTLRPSSMPSVLQFTEHCSDDLSGIHIQSAREPNNHRCAGVRLA